MSPTALSSRSCMDFSELRRMECGVSDKVRPPDGNQDVRADCVWDGAGRLASAGGGLAWFFERVAGAPAVHDVYRVARVVFELLAQITDVEPEVVRFAGVLVAPDARDERLRRDHLAGVLGESRQEPEFGWRKRDVDPIFFDLLARRVDFNGTDAGDCGKGAAASLWRSHFHSPEHRAQAQVDLFGRGFRTAVVISAGFIATEHFGEG